MLRITITRSGLAAIGKRGFQAAGRDAIHAAALYWWTKFLPLHFQNIAYLRYKYHPRSKKYNAAKRRRAPGPDGVKAIGEEAPLVFTGRSREKALANPNIKATAKNFETYNAAVIIDAPAFNFTAGKKTDARDEVTRLTSQENVTLENVFAKEWEKSLTAQGLKAPKRIRRTAAA